MMKIRFLKFSVSLLIAMLISAEASAMGENVSEEASEDVRRVAALQKLKDEPETVVLYARGLCCPSCSIGVRKMISRLKFVDRKRFNKGVDLDTKVQLVTVSILKGKSPDLASLTEAIDDAGYDPVRLYALDGGDLQTSELEQS